MTLHAFDEANVPLVRDLGPADRRARRVVGGNPDGPTEAQRPEQIATQWDAADIPERRAMLTQALGRNQLRSQRRQAPRRRNRLQLAFGEPLGVSFSPLGPSG